LTSFGTSLDKPEVQALTAWGKPACKVSEPLAVKSSGFFVALFQVNGYIPTFKPIEAEVVGQYSRGWM
jgi:hypothetical protein